MHGFLDWGARAIAMEIICGCQQSPSHLRGNIQTALFADKPCSLAMAGPPRIRRLWDPGCLWFSGHVPPSAAHPVRSFSMQRRFTIHPGCQTRPKIQFEVQRDAYPTTGNQPISASPNAAVAAPSSISPHEAGEDLTEKSSLDVDGRPSWPHNSWSPTWGSGECPSRKPARPKPAGYSTRRGWEAAALLPRHKCVVLDSPLRCFALANFFFCEGFLGLGERPWCCCPWSLLIRHVISRNSQVGGLL